jgi:hypothetical protein
MILLQIANLAQKHPGSAIRVVAFLNCIADYKIFRDEVFIAWRKQFFYL